jgi:hypothetical protein
MIEEDTIKLLRECNAGIKMGVTSIDEVLPKVKNSGLRESLEKCRSAHGKLGDETHAMLARYGDEGKEPSAMAKGMSWMKTNVMLSLEQSDKTVADLITDGCNMGVKSLSRYLNQYEAAEEKAKDIAKRLIGLESHLVHDVQPYL